jgi:hypothetical protein
MKALRLMSKWLKMLSGKSILHVNQDEGKVYSKDDVKGYYNNLTEKVLKPGGLLDDTGLVYNVTNEGKTVYFSITIFQYGLGAYDLWIMTGHEKYRKLFMRTVEWAVKNQEEDGAWDTFSIIGAKKPYSSMAQGEGASLLVRAYKETGDEKYLNAAKAAIDFMCLSVTAGGCTQYCNEKMWFKEYIEEPVVLNGWIFSIWGLYDYYKATKDIHYKQLLNKAVDSLGKDLAAFDCQYWSKYNMGNKLTSPFYHRLHISQLKIMYELFGCSIFSEYADKWEKYQRNRLYFCLAFLVKVSQKLTENNANKIIIVG